MKRTHVALLSLIASSFLRSGMTAAISDSLIVEPSNPREGQTFTITALIVDGSNFPLNADSQSFNISGNLIQLFVCQDGSNWSPNPPFGIPWTFGSLRSGTYIVQFQSECGSGPVQLALSTSFDVSPPTPIPTLSQVSVLALSALLTCFAFAAVWRRGLTRRSTRTPAGGLSPARRSPVSLLR
jgi:hypothetical protein